MTSLPAVSAGTPRGGRRAYVVLGVAVAAYFVGVVHRTALGVAGVEAIDRFGLAATGLALLSVVQLSFYALMQVPSGLLLDRFGARAMIGTGSLVMAGGQALLAVATTLPTALAARVLIGAGDAAIFISVVRLVALWFPPSRVPVLTQVTGLVGQAGQLASALPVAFLLHHGGWTTTFGTLAAFGLIAGLGAFAGIARPDTRPAPTVPAAPGQGREPLLRSIRLVVDEPGTRLGFWSHFVTPFSGNVFALLWGVPFLLTAQGLSAGEASLLLSLFTVTAMAAGPLIGLFTVRHPLRRSWAVLGTSSLTLVAWVLLLAQPTPRPLGQLAVFVVVIAVGGPASLVGMDFARSFAPAQRLGTATGFVNTGGFIATIGGVLAVGLVLQLVSPPGATTYSLDAYRAAFSVLAVPCGVGILGVLRNRRRTRTRMAATGVVVPPLRDAWRARGRG